jgi:hypothetical protein
MIGKPGTTVAKMMKLGARTDQEMAKCKYAGSGSTGEREPSRTTRSARKVPLLSVAWATIDPDGSYTFIIYTLLTSTLVDTTAQLPRPLSSFLG